MEDIKNQIYATLGADAEQFGYATSRTIRHGWRTYFPEKTVAKKLVENSWRAFHDSDIRLLIAPPLIDSAAKSYEPSTWGTPVYAFPGLPIPEVAELFEVGSHNAPPSEDWMDAVQQKMSLMHDDMREAFEKMSDTKRNSLRNKLKKSPSGSAPWLAVKYALTEIIQIAPFEIQLADSAGIQGTFLGKLTASNAKKIGEIVLTVSPDASEIAPTELESLGIPVPKNPDLADCPDYEAAMTKYIGEVGKLRMWWGLMDGQTDGWTVAKLTRSS